MSTIKTTFIQHPSAVSPAIELSADGSILLPLSGIGDLADVDEGSGAVDGDVLTYDGTGDVWVPQGLVLPAAIGSNVQQTVVNAAFSTSSATFVTVTGLEVTITPTSATSKILLLASLVMAPVAGNGSVSWQITGGNASTYLGTGGNNAVSHFQTNGSIAEALRRSAANQVGAYLDSPATASPVTYSVQVKSSSGTANVNQDSQGNGLKGVSSIIAIEVAA